MDANAKSFYKRIGEAYRAIPKDLADEHEGHVREDIQEIIGAAIALAEAFDIEI